MSEAAAAAAGQVPRTGAILCCARCAAAPVLPPAPALAPVRWSPSHLPGRPPAVGRRGRVGGHTWAGGHAPGWRARRGTAGGRAHTLPTLRLARRSCFCANSCLKADRAAKPCPCSPQVQTGAGAGARRRGRMRRSAARAPAPRAAARGRPAQILRWLWEAPGEAGSERYRQVSEETRQGGRRTQRLACAGAASRHTPRRRPSRHPPPPPALGLTLCLAGAQVQGQQLCQRPLEGGGCNAAAGRRVRAGQLHRQQRRLQRRRARDVSHKSQRAVAQRSAAVCLVLVLMLLLLLRPLLRRRICRLAALRVWRRGAAAVCGRARGIAGGPPAVAAAAVAAVTAGWLLLPAGHTDSRSGGKSTAVNAYCSCRRFWWRRAGAGQPGLCRCSSPRLAAIHDGAHHRKSASLQRSGERMSPVFRRQQSTSSRRLVPSAPGVHAVYFHILLCLPCGPLGVTVVASVSSFGGG